jgi:signal transduction histidine kinase
MAQQNKPFPIKTQISLKLFFSSVLSILVFTVLLFFLVKQSLIDLGQFSETANTQQIKQISNQFLASMAREKSRKYDEIFLHCQTTVTFLRMKAEEAYRHPVTGNGSDDALPSMTLNPANKIFFTPESDPLITAFWGDTSISPAIESELRSLSQMDPYLVTAQKNIHQAMGAHIITRTGIGKYYTLNQDMRQACFNLPNPAEFDIRDGEPMTTFTRQAGSDFSFRWTRPYKDDVAAGLMMTGVAPILDGTGRFRGITGIDIPLNSLIQDLDMDHPFFSDSEEWPGDFFAFLMDSNGRLISFPFSSLTPFGLDVDIRHFKQSDDILSLNLMDSRLPGVEQTVRHILDSESYQTTLAIDDQSYVLASRRIEQTGWHIVLVSNENTLLNSVRQTRQVLDANLADILKSFLLYAGIVFLLALGCNYLGVRRFIRPLQQLTRLTRQISREDLYERTGPPTEFFHGLLCPSGHGRYSEKAPENRSDEIGELSRAFNDMTRRLLLSQQREQAHIQTLSEQADRLRELNEHLVYSDESERKLIASDLHDSVAQTLGMGISRTKDLIESDDPPRPDQITEIQTTLEQAAREIRALIYKLSPPILDDFDIDIAIGALIEETNVREGTAYQYINHVTDPVPLSHPLKITLYRAANELLTNIQKHAGTPDATIQLWISGPDICLQVEDSGPGMEVGSLKPSKEKGFGLYSLSERIRNFGGTLTITSTPGKGTKILLTAPVNQTESHTHEKENHHHRG